MLELEELRLIMQIAKAHQQLPRIIKTQEEADKINAIEREFGLQVEWRIGDQYYLLSEVR